MQALNATKVPHSHATCTTFVYPVSRFAPPLPVDWDHLQDSELHAQPGSSVRLTPRLNSGSGSSAHGSRSQVLVNHFSKEALSLPISRSGEGIASSVLKSEEFSRKTAHYTANKRKAKELLGQLRRPRDDIRGRVTTLSLVLEVVFEDADLLLSFVRAHWARTAALENYEFVKNNRGLARA